MDHLFATDNKALNRMSIWFATCINGQREIEVSSGVIIQDQVGSSVLPHYWGSPQPKSGAFRVCLAWDTLKAVSEASK